MDIKAIRRALLARRARRGEMHEWGLCGPMASLCAACAREEREALMEWAQGQPDPEPGESAETYWRRIQGPFWDAWYEVAVARGAAPAR